MNLKPYDLYPLPRAIVVVALAAVLLPLAVFAAGQQQWLTYQDYGGVRDTSTAIAIQADGKTIVGGTNGIGTFDVIRTAMAVTRLLPNGAPDNTFDGDGKLTIDFGTMNSSVTAVAVQPDGKIVVGGNLGDKLVVIRLNTDGSFDTTFHVTGRYTHDRPSVLNALTVLPSGKVLAAGCASTVSEPVPNSALFQLTPEGDRDGNFGFQGVAIAALSAGNDCYLSAAVQPDGKIVAGGSADFGPGEGIGFVVTRHNSNGSPDFTFDDDSFTLTNFGSPTNGAVGLAIQADGKIVAAGSTAGSQSSVVLTRLNPNGSYDTSFDGDGKVITPPGANLAYRALDVAIQSNGKIVAAGFAQTSAVNFGAGVFRYRRDGSLDTSFDGDGILVLQTGNFGTINGVAIQPNSSIRLAGTDSVQTAAEGFTFSITGDQQTPVDFDADGKTDTAFQRASPRAWWINFSTGNTSVNFLTGNDSVDRPVPADYTGDGRTDLGQWNRASGIWTIIDRTNGNTRTQAFGADGDIPAPSDYDGDGKADLAIFRPSNGNWYISNSSNGTFTITPWGSSGDIPMPGDYDADGLSDLAIFRRNSGTGNGEWWINRSTAGQFVTVFGANTDTPVAADYTGDGKVDVAFWRPSNGFWYVLRSEDFNYYAGPFGMAGDIPVPGDYDGDGKADVAVFRGSTGIWYLNTSHDGLIFKEFGGPGDRPLPAWYIP